MSEIDKVESGAMDVAEYVRVTLTAALQAMVDEDDRRLDELCLTGNGKPPPPRRRVIDATLKTK